MKDSNQAVIGTDIMTLIAVVFILVGMIMASMATSEVIKHFEPVKTKQSSDIFTPSDQESAKVFFVLKPDGGTEIRYQGESGKTVVLDSYDKLLSILQQDAPKFILLKSDARYPYGDIGKLMMDSVSLNTQIFAVAENG